MSASPKLQEPSMEEILASIRRIIADDQGRAAEDPLPEGASQPERDAAADLADLPRPVLPLGGEDAGSDGGGPEVRPRSAPEDDALMSRATDASVGQAFGLLAHTVLSGNPRPIEDVVREMLRPMLRAWLDDNLPTIVERLVRAEIERVARGGR